MPGIAGLITRMPYQRAVDHLLCMVETMRHEDFYVTGTWADESLGVYVGWAMRRDSFPDETPISNERGNKILVFSGEDFPDPETIQNLRKQGHDFNETGSSYLVHLAEEDPSFPSRLNGRFHGLLVDRALGVCTVFNDRYGMHRLYYRESKDAFYFAAEAKAILALESATRSIDPQGLGEFVSCGSVLENRTLFAGIHTLPPASAWTFRNATLEKRRSYFNPQEWEEQEKLDPGSYYSELRRVFSENLPRYFKNHERIGMSVTGGLDTRMILAWRKGEPGSLPCYTFGSAVRENQDVRVGRRLAEACRQPHRVINVGAEFLARFPLYAERAVYLSDGCVDVGRAPDLYLSEQAREIAPIRMTGNYGGEILRRVRAFKPAEPLRGLFRPEFVPYIHQAKEIYRHIASAHPVTFAAFRQAPWHQQGVLGLEQSQLSVRSPFLDNDFIRTVFRSPVFTGHDNAISLRLVADGDETLLRIPTDRGLAGKQRRLSSGFRRAWREFQFKAEYAYDMGMPQWLARVDRAFSFLRLERFLLGRHKVFHFRVWYRDTLARYVQELLLDARSLSRPYIERRSLEAVVRGHIKGDRNFTNEIHQVLTLELIQRHLLSYSAIRHSASESKISVSM